MGGLCIPPKQMSPTIGLIVDLPPDDLSSITESVNSHILTIKLINVFAVMSLNSIIFRSCVPAHFMYYVGGGGRYIAPQQY